MNEFSRNITLHDLQYKLENYKFIKELEVNILNSDEIFLFNESEDLFNFYYNDYDIEIICHTIEKLYSDDKNRSKKQIVDLLNIKNFYGTYHELMTYSWLLKHQANFQPQVSGIETLSKNEIELDGKFIYNRVCFDIKAFEIPKVLKKEVVKKIEKEFPDYIIMIEGNMGDSYINIQKATLNNISKIVDNIKNVLLDKLNKEFVLYKVPDIDWTIRMEKRKAGGVYSAISHFDPYEWAKQNRNFFLKNVTQYSIDLPFILICSMNKDAANILTTDSEMSKIAFRAIARRAFIETIADGYVENNCKNNLLKKVRDDIKKDNIPKYLSAIMILNLQDDKSYIYTNPNAIHKVSRSKIMQLFDYETPLPFEIFDDFINDNY